MTLFEYLAIAFSLVFSFAAMRLVSGLPHALHPERRYWVHLSLSVVQLFATAGIFWIFWSYRDIEWTFPRFLLALGSPVLVYFSACALIPEAPASVQSWREHYFAARTRYFAGMCLWALIVTVSASVLVEMPLDHPARLVQASIFALGVVGVATANPRVHGGIAAVLVGLAVAAALLLVSRPGAIAPP